MKRALMVLLMGTVALALLSCSGYNTGDSSAEARRYEILQALDSGNYDFVIQALEPDPTYDGAFTSEEGRLNLAAAYVGKAGFDINDIVKSMINSSGQQQNNDFQNFISTLSETIGGKGYPLLDQATVQYKNIIPDCTLTSLTDIQKDACFYRGIVDATKAATATGLIVGDIDSWLNPQGCTDDANNDNISDGAQATACAIVYAENSATDCGDSDTTTNLASQGNVIFNTSTGQVTLELTEITIGPAGPCTTSNTFYNLITNNGEVVVTDGTCDTNLNPCTGTPSGGCYPCPVFDPNGQPYTVVNTVVDAIGSSADALTALLPQNSDVSQSIQDFLTEVCGNDGTCTQSDIETYLQ